MTEADEKAAFAALLLKYPDDPFKAGSEASPYDSRKGLIMAVQWPNDPEVLKIMASIRAKGEDATQLPGKGAMAVGVWALANNPLVDPKDRIAAFKLYGDIFGYVSKTTDSSVTITNRVMVVREIADPDQWEREAMNQQRELKNVSATRH